MITLHYKRILSGSPAYEEMVALRLRVLLDPIGIPRSYINPQKEAGDFLLGAYQQDVLVACCILTPLSGQVVQLRQMAVDLPFQKKGTGAALLSFAEKIGGKKDIPNLCCMHGIRCFRFTQSAATGLPVNSFLKSEWHITK